MNKFNKYCKKKELQFFSKVQKEPPGGDGLGRKTPGFGFKFKRVNA